MKTFIIKTLGCKVNQCDSDGISASIISSGLLLSDDLKKADLIIINTCAVTQKAAAQSRQVIRRSIRDNPNSKVIVTGCYAQISPEEIDGIGNLALILDKKNIIVENIKNKSFYLNQEKVLKKNIFPSNFYESTISKRTRPFVKIQDGCDSFCTYCIVPYTRGKSKSLAENKVLDKLNFLKLKGYKEVVLTGIHIGNYGKDFSYKTNLYMLLCKIISKRYIERIRISSIEPLELSTDIILLTRNTELEKSRICRHFHIPLQSGDNSILKRMHRPYDNNYFTKLIEKILHYIPTCSIGLDIIVGFPGETEKSFYNTYKLLKDLPISYLHVFPFSPRKGTVAWNYLKKISPTDIKERCMEIRKLSLQKQQLFYSKFLNKTIQVLVENKRDKINKQLKGLSENYIIVHFNGPDSMYNTIQYVKINKITKYGYAEGSIKKRII